MSPHNVLVVYGTRPEAIKVAPLIHRIARDSRFTQTIVSTGQHREMLRQVEKMFSFSPDIDLEVMHERGTLNQIVSRVIDRIDPVLEAYRPDLVLVHGDTSSAMAAAIAAFNRKLPVAHLEAGLRTDSVLTPFPEEANRRLISRLASLHLAPTVTAKARLVEEGVRASSVAVTGNTVIDALLMARDFQKQPQSQELRDALKHGRRIILVTTHRRENIEALASVALTLRRLADSFKDDLIAIPLHPNPAVRAAVLPAVQNLDNILVLEPLPYDEFTSLMDAAHLVLTDSGGIQEEAPSLGKPVVVMRNSTERHEGVAAGAVRLVGTDPDAIFGEVARLLNDPEHHLAMSRSANPYGDGHASSRSIAALAEFFGTGDRLPDFAP